MLYIIIGIGLLFITMAFLVTENNSKYLLSGYNAMSEAERKMVDIKSYLPYFKKFHLFLGVSFIGIGLFLHYAIGESASGIFIGVYPILAYIYFIRESNKYWKGSSNKWNKIGLYVLVATLILLIGLLALGFKENPVIISANNIQFKGSYGETLSAQDIASVTLVDHLPKITSKTNGFALGSIRKGYFKTKEGEKVKLIVNSESKAYLLFTKKNGDKIYFSPKEKSSVEIFNEVRNILPKDNEK
jgi:apolipoprotein N-acyltransferase|tara:strand:- start:57 stop:788 length:732 start_codon:yes stop_codon:yes gene_type:complete